MSKKKKLTSFANISSENHTSLEGLNKFQSEFSTCTARLWWYAV